LFLLLEGLSIKFKLQRDIFLLDVFLFNGELSLVEFGLLFKDILEFCHFILFQSKFCLDNISFSYDLIPVLFEEGDIGLHFFDVRGDNLDLVFDAK